ncbi:MAG: hypothetical protein HUU20_21275 [Pirellulales bacterium]|nr:hypothetical protein [Pirellulales bacterium]
MEWHFPPLVAAWDSPEGTVDPDAQVLRIRYGSEAAWSNRSGRFQRGDRRIRDPPDPNFARNHPDRHLLRHLTRTPRWRTLCRLSWSGNDCGNDGAEALLAADNDGGLQELELATCGIGPEHEQRLIARYGARVRFEERPARR